MKKFRFIFVFVFIAAMILTACGDSGSVKSISLSKNELTLRVGEEETLTVAFNPADTANKVVTWTTSNAAAATVSVTGKITAVAEGEAVITAKSADGNKTDTCVVTVVPEGSEIVTNPKPIDGIPILFDEGLSYYNINPEVLYTDANTMYVYYTVNKTANGEDDVIAVRRATLNSGVWVYSSKSVVLQPTADSWDSERVSNPSVVAGKFNYDGEEYGYLMAYQGNNTEDTDNFGIGFAVAKDPAGPFVKTGASAAVSYDGGAYGEFWGIGQPSLVSYDGEGCVYLFYTMGDPISTQTYVMELDCSDMEDIDGLDIASALTTNGLSESNPYITFNDAGFALDVVGGYLYTVRNVNPPSANAPVLHTSVQMARLPIADLYSQTGEWEVIKNISMFDLVDWEIDGNTGWKRIYSGCFATDAYGGITDNEELTVAITVTSWDIETKEYLHYQTMAMCTFDND